MEIYADIRHKVEINPIDVIEKLIEKELGYRGWIFKEAGKYYRGYERSAGTHSIDSKEEITKEKYNYIKNLQLVNEYLNHEKSK